MITRNLLLEELDIFIPIVREYFEEMNTVNLRADEKTYVPFIKERIEDKNSLVLVCIDEGKIVGACGVFIAGTFMCADDKRGIEFLWHSNKELSKITRYRIQLLLLQEMEDFCIKNMVPLHIGTKPNNTLCDCLIARDYVVSEINLVRGF